MGRFLSRLSATIGSLVIGQTISHYRIIEQLGSGGMGQVYLAEDVRLGRKLAVKVLEPKLVTNPERVRRFGQEARAASALNHPNILTIHDIGQAGDVHFIATEFVDGETLRVRLNRGRLALREVLEIAIQAGNALAAAHDAGIVHRDVKPENVMLRPDGYVKVLDFGLAKLTVSGFGGAVTDGLTRTVMETNPGVVLGTFSYMSPEQARSEAIDARSDIFSLGIMLYEMIAGRLPFRGATPADVLGAILYVEPTPVSSVSSAPDTLARVVGQAISKRPEARYQTMDGLVADLKAVRRQIERDSSGVPSQLPSDSTVLDPFDSDESSRDQTGVTRSVTPSSVGRSSGAAPTRRRSARRRIDSLAVLPLENASQDPEMEYLSDGITEAMINGLSQLPKLRVMARSTVFRYKGRTQEPQAIGRDLSVRAVLTGRVLHRGDMLVIGAELVDVEDGSQIWGGQFNRRLSGIFELQEEISNEMTDKLRLRLTGDQKKRLAKPATRQVEAYQAYLKGRYLVNKRTSESFAKAIELFEAAIATDPSYAAAYAGLGETYALSAALGFSLIARPEEIRRARAAAARALELEETLVEGHALVAFLKFRFDWDWNGADLEFKRALELNPGHAPSHHSYAMFLGSRGRFDEALQEMRRAQQLDPLSLVVASGIGRILHFAGRFDEAVAQYRHVIQMDPTFSRVWFDLALTLMAMGAYDEAFQELKKAGSQPFALTLTTVGQALAGHRDRASAAVGRLEEYARAGTIGHDDLAMVYAAIGESKRASELLERACDERAAALAYAAVEPVMEFLRTDSECRRVLERAGLIGPRPV
jgi:eukaryotic-like serine/threonine-protein kinase